MPGGGTAGRTGDNILLARDASLNKMAYQVYGKTQRPTPPSVVSRDPIPDGQWLHVVVVQRGAVASMFWRNATSGAGGAFELQASGRVNTVAHVNRISNRVGVSNWAADAKLKGAVRGLRIYNRALSTPEIAALGSATVLSATTEKEEEATVRCAVCFKRTADSMEQCELCWRWVCATCLIKIGGIPFCVECFDAERKCNRC